MVLEFCPLFSGSSGNCLYAAAGDTRLLIDAGVTCKKAVAALQLIGVDPATLSGILVTHEHTDHIAGIGVLSRKYRLPVYANEKTWQEMSGKVGSIAEEAKRVFTTGEDFHIQDLRVQSFLIPHDAAEPVGFSIKAAGRKVSVMTDLGYASDDVLAAVSGSDVLLIEANHDLGMLANGSYPAHLKRRIRSDHGHLSNAAAAVALVKLAATNVKTAVLGHLSQCNNSEKLAYATVAAGLREAGIQPEQMRLHMAFRDRVGGYFRI